MKGNSTTPPPLSCILAATNSVTANKTMCFVTSLEEYCWRMYHLLDLFGKKPPNRDFLSGHLGEEYIRLSGPSKLRPTSTIKTQNHRPCWPPHSNHTIHSPQTLYSTPSYPQALFLTTTEGAFFPLMSMVPRHQGAFKDGRDYFTGDGTAPRVC